LHIRYISSITDQELIAHFLSGEDLAFEAIYKRHVAALLSHITRKIGCTETAREIAQEIFLEVYQQKERLADVVQLDAWLFAIARHKIFNHYRRRLVERKYISAAKNEVIEFASEPSLVLERKEMIGILQSTIETLPPQCKRIFLLSRQQHLSYKEIAKKLSISENTVDQHIRRALRKLRSTIENYGLFITFLLFR
jgi:RNA polymerase sigma-70 factor (family 1)